MDNPIETLKEIKKGLKQAPDGSKQAMSYSQLSRHCDIPEQQLIRWMTGKNNPSPAWMVLLRQKLS